MGAAGRVVVGGSGRDRRRAPRPLPLTARARPVRDAEPVGRRLGEAARLARVPGARDDLGRPRLVARQAGPAGHPRRARRARRGARGRDSLPLNVDSERCYPDEPGGVAETVALLAAAGAAGCSVEDYDPAAGAIEPLERRGGTRARAPSRPRAAREPMVVTGRGENHISGVDDLDDTIERLVAYRDAGADCRLRARPRRPRPDQARGRGGRRARERARAPDGAARGRAARRPECGASRPAARSRASPLRAALDAATELRDEGTAGYGRRGIDDETLRRALG